MMKLLGNLVLVSMLIIVTPEASLAEITPVFTLPRCQSYQYPASVGTESGSLVTGPTGNLFCTSADFQVPLQSRSEVFRALTNATAGRMIADVVMSSYLYSEPEVASLLCGLKYAPDSKIMLLAQRAADSGGRISTAFALETMKCPIAPRFVYFGCDVFDVEDSLAGSGGQCPKGRINVLHLKAIHVKFDDGTTLALLGSGNINRSLYANIEDWLLYVGPQLKQSIPIAISCMTQAVQASSGRGASAEDIAEYASDCMSTWPKQDSTMGFVLEFAPSNGPAYRERLLRAIQTADSVDVVAQAFEDPDLVAALLQNQSASVRVVADDDWYWALRNGKDFYTAKYEKLKWALQLPKVSLRFLQTNHSKVGGVGNTLHTRLIIVRKGGVRTVFTGSAHYRPGTFVRNVEHLLTITDEVAVQRYVGFVDDLWSRGVLWQEMPLTDTAVVVP